MKQTNNAIKFLMAQYRAIFRNANLKMFLAAATAAAALSAGQAQAAPAVNIQSWDELVSGQYDGGDQDDNKKFEITGDAAKNENSKDFAVEVTGGTNFIKGAKGAVEFKTGAGHTSSITINGTAPDTTKLVIGEAAENKNAKVTIDSFTNTQGILEIAGHAADTQTEIKTSSLNAAAITIGDASHKTNDKAVVNVNAYGSLNATGDEGLTITKGAKITVAENASVTGKISMDDGIVNLSGADATAALGSASSTINITGGTVEAVASKSGSMVGSSIVLSGGTLDAKGTLTVEAAGDGKFEAKSGKVNIAKGQSLTLKGVSEFTGATITNSEGNLVIEGTATFADDTLDTSKTSGSTVLSATKGQTSTLNVSDTGLKQVLSGGIKASGAGTGVLNISGTTAIELDTVGFLDNAGALQDTKVSTEAASTLKVKGTTGSFTKADEVDGKDKNVVFTFDTLTLGKTAGSTDNTVTLKNNAAFEVANQITVGEGESVSTLKIVKGGLTLNGASGTVGAKAVELAGTAAGDAKFTVESGSWSVNDLTLKTSGAATVKGDLTVGGKLTIADADSVFTVSGGVLNLVGKGEVDFTAAGNNKVDVSGGVIKVDASDILNAQNALDDTKIKKAALKGDASSRLEISFADGGKLTDTQYKAIKDGLTAFHGIYKVDVETGITPGKDITLSELEKFPQLETSDFNKSTLTLESAEDIDKNYSIGNVITKGDGLTLKDGGALTLNTPKNDVFVGKKQDDGTYKPVDVTFSGTGTNSLTLVGEGKIGAIITTADTTKGTLKVGIADDTEPKSGSVTIDEGSIGSDGKSLENVTLSDKSKLTLKSGDLFAENLVLGDNTDLSVSGDVKVTKAAIDGGNIKVGSFALADVRTVPTENTPATFKFDEGKMNVTETLSFGTNNVVTIGTPATQVAPAADGAVQQNLGSSAQVFAGTVEIKSGTTIFVDPDYSQNSSLLVGQTLNNGSGTPAGTGKLAGSLAIGANSAIGFGFTEEEFNAVMAKHLENGKFVKSGGYANALVLNMPITVTGSNYININQGLSSATGTGTNLNLGEGAALILTEEAFGSDKAETAITLPGGGHVTVEATATDKKAPTIVLDGDFTAKDSGSLKIFNAGTTIDKEIAVSAAGGLVTGTLAANSTGGALTLQKNEEKLKEIRSLVSGPIATFFNDYADGAFANSTGTGVEFIQGQLRNNAYVAVDAAAHAATYAGAQQAAVAAVGTMAEAVGGRVGTMGVEATAITATGSQANGGVWVSPMYKSVDADGFNAEGASYGADVDLAGVAFGTDTVNGNMRFGAVFNIGSGDADGKGNGNGLKDEFDYYGFGIYSVMGFGNLALVGDASLNVISHDVSGESGLKDFGKLHGSADTTAVTMGLTGQYTISNPAVDVTPHLGVRFTRLDTDSYDLISDKGTVATTDFEVQNVFSIPLGVTLSKAFEMGGWSLAPNADFSITFNTGDTEVDSTTRFTGINRNLGLNTEVLDEVTYGVAVGLGAQYGAFGTNIGINYTGSENTDSFGVNAQARYMF